MRGKQKPGGRAKHLWTVQGSVSSVKDLSHLSRRAKRRLYCKVQLWMWRKRREKWRYTMFRATRQACLVGVHTQAEQSKVVSPVVRHAGQSADAIKQHGSLQQQRRECGKQTDVVHCKKNVIHQVFSQTAEGLLESCPQGKTSCSKEATTLGVSQRLKDNSTMKHLKAAPLEQKQAAAVSTVEGTISEPVHGVADSHSLRNGIREFLDDFYKFYGSFFPLQQQDVLEHLKTRFNTDFSDRKKAVVSEVNRYLTQVKQKPLASFQLVYNKHTLSLDDLSTLADQNWLNDQVMNLYGELIMESAGHKVHVLNSFFHRQLITKGYDGVKRWTRQVDLFSKRLLLVPIHLEVHWCLVAANNIKKKICLYDSQGVALQKVARNILKYLTTEAMERKQTAFQHGWALSVNGKIPQQTNENDCGVFVLEYSRCLALAKPLHFSQKDIPKIRKRMYKELCNCKLSEEA